MPWIVELATEFEPEFQALVPDVQDEILAHARLIEQDGPRLGRPKVDTLKGSKHANMKELRFDANGGVWRVAFAFDRRRRAMLLAAGNKRGRNESAFYKRLIADADARFDAHTAHLAPQKKGKGRKGKRRK